MELKISETKQRTAENFTDWIIDLIETHDSLHIALSGGSTPKIVFDELAKRGLGKHLWKKVYLYWGDERCVPPDDSESNYRMTVEHLLSKIEIPSENIHRIRGEENPKNEALRYSGILRSQLPNTDAASTVEDEMANRGKADFKGDVQAKGLPRFDLVILGMGDDGHTASIFPHEIELWNSEKLCEVAEHPETGQKRITITGDVINNAAIVAFLVTGESKAQKVGEIIDQRGDFTTYPANLVKPTHGDLYWFVDQAAASGITKELR